MKKLLGYWKLRYVKHYTNLSETFSYAENFNQDLSNWKTSKVTDMSVTFFNAKKFNSPLNKWDTSNVEQICNQCSMAHLNFKSRNNK
nr:BspA family leucine-rich repeat surface protein [Mycoplasmopsis bovis]